MNNILTSQKTNSYYERFQSIDVTFSKEIIETTGLVGKQIYLKCGSDSWPCVLYSTSFQGAKIVSNVKSGLPAKLKQANNLASLRLCFTNPDDSGPLTFFVSARVQDYCPYGDSMDMSLFTLQFTQRPPDAFVGIIGRLLDASINSTKRKDERILITPEVQRKLDLVSRETAVFIQGVPRRCIVRDLSFSGAKLIIMGLAKFLDNRAASLRLDFYEPRTSILLKGTFVRSEMVEGRQDLVAPVLQFDEALVPMAYKLRLNDYLGPVRNEGRPEGLPENREEKPGSGAPEEAAGNG